VTREKGKGEGGWVSQFVNISATDQPRQPMISALLLGRPALSEPYTILIMSTGFKGHCISFAQDVDTFAKSLPWAVHELPLTSTL
jgi:hypothetical protein